MPRTRNTPPPAPKDRTTSVLGAVEEVVQDVQSGVEAELRPLRKSVVRRFPVLFLLAVTFGASLVFFSIETLLARSAFVSGHPWLALGIGLAVLVITGTLYKKLD